MSKEEKAQNSAYITMLRRQEVCRRTGLSVPQIYALMSRGLFPRPVKLGLRAVAWPDSAIAAWIQERIQNSAA